MGCNSPWHCYIPEMRELITVRVKCRAQEHSAMALAKAWTTLNLEFSAPITAHPLNEHPSIAKSIYRATITQANIVQEFIKWSSCPGGGGGFSVNLLVGVCHRDTDTLTLFLTFQYWERSAWFSDPTLDKAPNPPRLPGGIAGIDWCITKAVSKIKCRVKT